VIIMKNKKGVSPVIATVLLIVIVVILALIIFIWARGFIKESVMKEGENVKLTCEKVDLAAVHIEESGDLQITNLGNIPIYRFNVLVKNEGDIINTLFEEGIASGQSIVVSVGSGEEILVVPVLLGQVKNSAKVSYVCEDNEVAVEME
jgi:flagellin-like protein